MSYQTTYREVFDHVIELLTTDEGHGLGIHGRKSRRQGGVRSVASTLVMGGVLALASHPGDEDKRETVEYGQKSD